MDPARQILFPVIYHTVVVVDMYTSIGRYLSAQCLVVLASLKETRASMGIYPQSVKKCIQKPPASPDIFRAVSVPPRWPCQTIVQLGTRSSKRWSQIIIWLDRKWVRMPAIAAAVVWGTAAPRAQRNTRCGLQRPSSTLSATGSTALKTPANGGQSYVLILEPVSGHLAIRRS